MKDLFAQDLSSLKAKTNAGIKLTDRQRLDWLRLFRSENIGPRTFQSLLNRFGGAEAALYALPGMLPQKNGRTVTLCSIADAEREMETAHRYGARFIARGEPDFPPTLAAIDAGPPIIAVKGRVEALKNPSVAIVGSRNASAAGLKMTERLAVGLNEAGFAIVSGLARGIDTRAHQTSLDFGTIAVLAGGLDRPYPPDNVKLLEALLDRGAVVAEMPFGWEPRGRDFPRRNRIISGLAYGTVIVEAARKSGSLITARFALEQNREVFAVPGSPLDPRAEGANDLIKQGATLVASAADVITVLMPMLGKEIVIHESYMNDDGASGAEAHLDEPLWDELDLPGIAAPPHIVVSSMDSFEEAARPAISFEPQASNAHQADTASSRERIVLALGPSPMELDEIIRTSGVPLRDAHSILLDLEMEGRIERHGGNRISLMS